MFVKKVDGIKFTATEEDILEKVEDLLYYYDKLDRIDDDIWKSHLVVCNSSEVENYLLKRLSESKAKFQIYDISKNKEKSYAQLRRYVESVPVVVTGLEEYTNYLQKTYYPNCFSDLYGKPYEEAKVWLYHDVINFLRDDMFWKSSAAAVFVFSESEYAIFEYCALDFCSLSGSPIDFNKAFQSDIDPRMWNLSDYYINKRQSPERFQKVMEKLR